MGFLDHSTNNIIIDAVLTDTGRRFLAKNDGSFSIVKFALGDDEVDYSTISKYGRTVGKERIEKNTPVFEAQTIGDKALKNRLISVSNPNLLRLPTLEVESGTTAGSTSIAMTTTGGTTGQKTVTLQQALANEQSIDAELRDQAFLVRINNQFLGLQGLTPSNIDNDGIATYIVVRDATSGPKSGSMLKLRFQTKSITQSQFDIYGSVSNKDQITTVATAAGIQSGALLSLSITIENKGTSS
jgi:hypothetical protein